MSERGTYYELLGIRRTATPAEIRDAYVRLMKRHHPDAATPRHGGPDLAPLLNRCYAVLRDPLARSQYDAQLTSLAPATKPTPGVYRSTQQSQRLRRRQMVIAAGGIAVTLLGLTLVTNWERPAREIIAIAQGWMSTRSVPTVAAVPVALPNLDDSRRITGRAQTLSLREAEYFSRECFANATLQGPLPTADRCVLFDVAFLYWQKTPPASSSFPAYFADRIVQSRHREAMTSFGAGAERRLASLRRRAFLSLIEALETSRPVAARSPQMSDQSAVLADVRAGERERLNAARVP